MSSDDCHPGSPTATPGSGSRRSEAGRDDIEKLKAAGIDDPAFELRLMQCKAGEDAVLLEQMVERRCAREPLSHILGTKPFWKDEFIITPDVLTPRADSETLIEAVIDYARTPTLIMDLGTGSGCLLISLLREFPDAKGVGVEASDAALNIAKKNATTAGVMPRCSWFGGDWNDLSDAVKADIIICNPPYIPVKDAEILAPEVRDHEPHAALFAGEDGLDAYRNLAKRVDRWMHAESMLCLEVGMNQAETVTALFAERFERVECRKDLAGIPRALLLRLKD